MKKQILILHGWGGSKQTWEKCLENFDRNKYEIHVPDLPGFGNHEAPATPWNLQNYVDHVKQLIEKNSLQSLICIAHSFGGRIAIKLAFQHKDIFSELFLVAAAGVKHKPSFKMQCIRMISHIGKAFINFFKLHSIETKARELLYKAAGTKDYLKAEGTMKETFQMVIEEDLTPLLSEIKVKTHIIWGKKDSYVPVADAYLMNSKIPNSTIDVIADGKHGLHLQMPAKLVKLVETYLNQK